MFKKRIVASAFIAASIFVVCPSIGQAAVVQTTYTGFVDDGIDYLGLFGPAGASLAGRYATTNYIFLSAAPSYATNPQSYPYAYTVANNPGPGETYVLGGGQGQDHASPYLVASETINGRTQTIFALAGSGYLTSGFNATQNYRQDYALVTSTGPSGLGDYDRISTSIGVERSEGHIFPSAINDPSTFAFDQADSSETEFRFAANVPTSYDVRQPELYADSTTRLFIKQYSMTQSVLVQDLNSMPTPSFDLPVNAVPETSTWTMMGIGFITLAFLARRRISRGELAVSI